MPKRVDHEERRRQIADALLRTAAARGLHATGMREVAAEAGVSLRLVQYYFGTKEELLLSGMQHLAARFGEQAMTRIRRIKETGGQVGPRDAIAAILAEALPVDDERRTFAVLNAAYFALALTDPALAIAPLVKNTNAVIDVIAAQLRAAQAAGDTPAHLDPDAEALSLLAMSAGLGNSVLAGQSSLEQAQAVIDYHLDRLFPASRPALRRAPVTTPRACVPPEQPFRVSGGKGVGAVPPQHAGLITSSGMGGDGLLAWAERSGRRPVAGVGRGGLRFVFYGRVSTEDYQDPVTSRARQHDQADALVAGHGRIVAHFFDIGQSRVLPWAGRPQAAALVAAMADPDRAFDAIVVGEYERAFYGSQYALMAPLFEHYGVQLWMPEAGGLVDFQAEGHEAMMIGLGIQSKREITRTRILSRSKLGFCVVSWVFLEFRRLGCTR